MHQLQSTSFLSFKNSNCVFPVCSSSGFPNFVPPKTNFHTSYSEILYFLKSWEAKFLFCFEFFRNKGFYIKTFILRLTPHRLPLLTAANTGLKLASIISIVALVKHQIFQKQGCCHILCPMEGRFCCVSL